MDEYYVDHNAEEDSSDDVDEHSIVLLNVLFRRPAFVPVLYTPSLHEVG
jgi:hypothetical protein